MNPADTRNHRIEAAPEITFPTAFDVINGRGQGIQRHPGNMKYRTLVYLNKGLYAKCPRHDKSKISKGIVAAIRQVGGRFLEFDEASGVYNDIGDKKAYEKTSQALREGQSKKRKQIDEEKDPNSRVALLLQNQQRELSSEGYFGYELQLLLSLHRPDNLSAAGSSANHQFAPSPAPDVMNLTDEAYSPYITPSPTANRQIFNHQIFPSHQANLERGASAGSDNVAASSSLDPHKVSLQSPHGSADNNESWRSSMRKAFNSSFHSPGHPSIFPSLPSNHQVFPSHPPPPPLYARRASSTTTAPANLERGASGGSDNVAASISLDPHKVSLQSSHGSAGIEDSWRSSMGKAFNASFSNVYNGASVRPSIGAIREEEVVAPGPLSRPGSTGERTSGRKPSASTFQRPNLRDYKIEDWDSTRTLQTSNLSSQTDATKYQICPSRATNNQVKPSSESEVAKRT